MIRSLAGHTGYCDVRGVQPRRTQIVTASMDHTAIDWDTSGAESGSSSLALAATRAG